MRDFVRNSGDNIFPDPITAEEVVSVLCEFFLGEDYYVVDPLPIGQMYVIMLEDILRKFPRKYKKFRKKHGWER